MTDILDINSSVEFEHDEAGDKNISNLKETARKRKGRGLNYNTGQYQNYDYQRSIMQRTFSENWDTDESVISSVPTLSKSKPEKTKDLTLAGDVVAQKSIEGWVLFASPIHEEATEEDLYDKFSDAGPVKSIGINLDRRTGFLKGYALIEYSSYDEALQAKESLDGSELLGFNLNVNWCFIKRPNKFRVHNK